MHMQTFGKFLTTKLVYHGPGAVVQLADEIKRLRGRRVGVVTDPGIAQAGLMDKVCEYVPKAERFSEIQPEPPVELVGRCVEFLRDQRCNLVIGLGGGSSIDTAKMAAVLITNPGTVADYFGLDRVLKPGLPVIAIPTTAGTGSEVSPASVFVDSHDKIKKGVRSDYILPEVAILDPELTVSLPQRLTATTGIDALTHAIECYTSPRATMLSDLAAERAIRLLAEYLPVAYANGRDMQAREGALMGSYLAGIALSVANVGAVHALAQTLGGLYNVTHGVANSLFLPYVMEFNRIACKTKYARVAALLGEIVDTLSPDDASRQAVVAVRKLTLDLNIPQRIRDLDVPEGSIQRVADLCLQTQQRLLATNPRTLSLEEAQSILTKAY